ncbi:MAG TPA: hypothetical protein VLG68_02100 [Gammaproteobacteria bacterium]|nr:hypothetical protein [Gammaproteobacteria bacterium]
MKIATQAVLLISLALPLAAAADQSGNPPAQDVFSYSYLQLDHQSVRSDFFADRSAGNGLKFSYDFADSVYLFGQWNRLDFEALPGNQNLLGFGVGAHQAYSEQTSFYIDLALLRDKLDATAGGASDDYWRVSYGFRMHANSLLELDGGIFTERNTDFGRRPFGERLGFGLDFSVLSLMLSGEHTADGNRAELALIWAYK